MDLNELIKQEKSLELTSFNNNDAWILGNIAKAVAEEKGIAVSISIEKNNQIVFQYALEGTAPINDIWIIGKQNVVKLLHHSSLYGREAARLNQEDVDIKLVMDERKYLYVGGSIPICVKDTGVVGSLTISGLTDEMDHEIAVEILKLYIKLNNKA